MEKEAIDRLEKAALAATPGPWFTDRDKFSDEEGWVHTVFDKPVTLLITVPYEGVEEAQVMADTKFISEANPAAILALLREHRIAMRQAQRVNRCPNDGRPLIFDDPNSGHCGICHFTFSGFPDWNYEPLPLTDEPKP